MTEADGLSTYLAQISGFAVPTIDEERSLVRRARLGREATARLRAGEGLPGDSVQARMGTHAHQELLRRNLKLVVSVAKRYPTSSRVDLSDLIQEGNIALDHAIEKFDERRGFKLSTYAVKWIRQAVSRALDRQAGVAQLPIETARQVRSALRDHAGDYDALPGELRDASLACVGASLDAPGHNDADGVAIVELLALDDSLEDVWVDRLWQADLIRRLLGGVDPVARQALIRRFGLEDDSPRSLNSLAQELGIGAKRTKTLLDTALTMGAHLGFADDDSPESAGATSRPQVSSDPVVLDEAPVRSADIALP